MNNKKLFVYLHGNSFDKDNNKEELAKVLNHLPDTEFYSFDAPYIYKKYNNEKRRTWLNKDENNNYIEDESYFFTLKYTKDHINHKLKELDLTWKDLILCGRSQGSLIAIITALQNDEECHCLLTLGSVYVDYIESFNIKSTPKFYWFEMEDENVLSKEKVNGYKALQEKGVDLEWILAKGSDHDYISDDTIELMINKLKECDK